MDWHNSFANICFTKQIIMADEKAQHTANQQNEKSHGDVYGRIHNSQNPAFEQDGTRHDISSVDQQEGNMNNGECGGNLGKENETTEAK